MYRTDFEKWMRIAGVAAMAACNTMNADGCCDDEDDDCDECVCENEHAPQHLHFSSQDVDFYEETPDTLYREADWPAKVEEFSDYMSR